MYYHNHFYSHSIQGLRHVHPYYFTFKTHCKGRWVGRTLIEVFKEEFRSETQEYYVSICTWQCSTLFVLWLAVEGDCDENTARIFVTLKGSTSVREPHEMFACCDFIIRFVSYYLSSRNTNRSECFPVIVATFKSTSRCCLITLHIPSYTSVSYQKNMIHQKETEICSEYLTFYLHIRFSS